MSSGASKKPGIPQLRPKDVSNELWFFLNAIKEIVESYEGVRGSAKDKVITWDDLNKLGFKASALATAYGSYNMDILKMYAREAVTQLVNTDYNIKALDRFIEVDTSGGNRIVYLPNANTLGGKEFTITRVVGTSNSITLTAQTSQNINGANTKVMSTALYSSVSVYCNNTGYRIISEI